MKKLTQEGFIKRSNTVHQNKYIYDNNDYINCHTKVCIICPEHGVFQQTPSVHLKGQGCPYCSGRNSNLNNGFILKANKKHDYKYDYSKSKYININEKIYITCPVHGDFLQTPHNHLCGKGCPKCKANKSSINLRCDINEFILKARNVHENKYNYDKVTYVNNNQKICIICPDHGEFWQTPKKHICLKHGCPKCSGRYLTNEEWVNRFKDTHGNKYDYVKSRVINAKTKICIICPKHGEFWQKPHNHVSGQNCPKCAELSSHQENEIIKILKDMKILFEYRYKNFIWLKSKRKLELDFYIPQFNIAIEVQGKQHFKANQYFGGNNGYEKTIKRDKLKKELCQQYGVKLYYINYNDNTENELNNILQVYL
jgi:hypothetical protein